MADLKAATCWSAEPGFATFLTFEFGARIPRRKRDGSPYEQGAFSLWIYMAHWALATTATRVQWCDPMEDITRALGLFVGTSLVSIIDAPVTLLFSGESRPLISL